MTEKTIDVDFMNNLIQYQLASSLLSHSATSNESIPGSLPSNAIVFQPQNTNSSFNHYINTHFKEDAPIFLDRIIDDEEKYREISMSNDQAASSNRDNNRAAPFKSRDLVTIEYDSILDKESSLMTMSPRFFSLGAFLFLFGFICPPFWWIGSFYPLHVDTNSDKMEYDDDIRMKRRWKVLNRYFSLGFSTILVISIVILAILYTKL